MLRNHNFQIGDLIRFKSGGLEVATFVDIREALIARYKEVYGTDIDVSTANADGTFINDLALIINNILQVCKMTYANLNVETASGTYLDALCKLANVTRQPATRSTASLVVTNLLASEQSFGDPDVNNNMTNVITFVDRAGTEWIYRNASVRANEPALTLSANESAEVTVECTESGPVDAPAGWITQTVITQNLSVNQPEDCVRGKTIESDQALRKRRAQSSGAAGIAVLESLVGSLLNISGIEDVRVYNNNGLSSMTAADGTSISAHNVYVVLRQQDGINIDNATIGDLIYEKLTPGIKTTQTTDATTGASQSHEYIPEMLGVTINVFDQVVYWKVAKPITPQITITITPSSVFNVSEIATIAQAVYEYANELQITDQINADNVFIEVLQADPMFRSQRTYTLGSSDVIVASHTNTDTYYDYETCSYSVGSDGKYTIHIPAQPGETNV